MKTIVEARELIERELHQRTVVVAWLGFGDPLFLKFARVPSERSNEPNRESAVCELETNFANWTVEGLVTGNSEHDDREWLESAAQSLIGATVSGLELAEDGSLAVRFDESRILRIIPWPVEEGLSDAWSMTLPHDKILAISTARHIAVVGRHVPIRDWFAAES